MCSRAAVLLCSLLALAGAQGYGAGAPPVPQGEIKSIKGFERFQAWSRLVWAHAPGELDDSVRIVNAWPDGDLSAVRADLWAIVTLVSASRRAVIHYTGSDEEIPPTRMARPASRPRSIRIGDLPDLVILPRDRLTGRFDEADITRFMKRAAMLHTDVMMLSPPAVGLPSPPPGFDRASPAGRIVDGQVTGWDARPIHWELARTALDGVRPTPGADRLVAAWYRATSAHMDYRREYGYLAPHLAKGRAILPQDAHLQLYTGVLHEAYAGPVVQVALQALSSRGARPVVKSATDELKLAEGFFRRALDLDPSLDTARVHLGRVSGLLGRHDQAVGELRRALSSLTDTRQRYYAELFLGAGEQAAGRRSESKAAFERASSLFPDAQAPYLALGQLDWQAGDRSGAQAAFEALAGLRTYHAGREDPWWYYEVSAVLDAAALVENLRRLAAEDVQK